MRYAKRLAVIFAALLSFAACAPSYGAGENAAPAMSRNAERLAVIAGNFVAYDFARQVAGDLADVQLLLPAGTKCHGFDPSPRDILAVQNADLFVYTSHFGEPWVQSMLTSMRGDVQAVALAEHISLVAHAPDGDVIDPHIWLNLPYAVAMVEVMIEAMSVADPSNQAMYFENGRAYTHVLLELDAQFQCVMQRRARDTLVFGNRYAAAHFSARYDLHAVTVLDSCHDHADPSVQTVFAAMTAIRDGGHTVVFGIENDANHVANTLADETNTQMLVFHAAHNVSADERGMSFADIMRQNLQHVSQALTDNE
ncbi:MAG: zinc ABC transporter substrate-binding protein [Oscillospiraceae bacterium]|nr:zinc ABC transporter substrate-binding protein [Oscillospiraceae bacterium]